MFIAMNRFQVVPQYEREFERVWSERDTHLANVPGFVEFHLLRGPRSEPYALYSSHTVWASHADFAAWTKSDAFREAHRSARSHGHLYLDHPRLEGFEVILSLAPNEERAVHVTASAAE